MRPTKIAGINGTYRVNITRMLSYLLTRLFYRTTQDLLIDVYYDGTVTCTPTAIINVACKTDVSNFPYDEKRCTLIFGRYFNDVIFGVTFLF